jgi:DNA-binding winged helix-turn-helix (wHTH) protein/Flp pilus assembly protein TadD
VVGSVGPGKIYRFGSLRIDSGRRIVEQEGGLVSLAPKVVDTLIVLVENAGKVVDKETLFRAVWPGAFVAESSLTKNISLLRKTLDEVGCGSELIQTVSKRGYIFTGAVEEDAPLVTDASVNFSLPSAAPPARDTKWIWMLVGVCLLLIAVLLARPVYRSPAPADSGMTQADREYLVGQHIWKKFERSEMEKALGRFQRAAQLDPKSALAQAGIADTYVFMTLLAIGNPLDNLTKARVAATRAVALDAKLGRPRVSLGFVRLLADFDANGSEQEYRRAIASEPRSAHAYYAYACLLAHMDRLSEARSAIRRARELDPVSPLIGVQAARIEYYDRRFHSAIALLREMLEREPSFSSAHYYMAMSLGELGRIQEARDHLKQARIKPSVVRTDEVWLDARAGNREPARQLLVERMKEVSSKSAKATVVLLPAVDAGDNDLALWALEEMAKTREIELVQIKVNPRLDPLRSDARFKALVERLWPANKPMMPRPQ